MSAGHPEAQPRLRATSITIGTAQSHDLAHFYGRLLGVPVTADEPPVPGDPVRGGWAQIRPSPPGPGPTLNFEYEQHFTRPTWPSVHDGQNATQHLDIAVDDLAAAVRWAVEQGAASPKSNLKTTSVSFSTLTVTRSACSKRQASSSAEHAEQQGSRLAARTVGWLNALVAFSVPATAHRPSR